jgi:hypothetical protein
MHVAAKFFHTAAVQRNDINCFIVVMEFDLSLRGSEGPQDGPADSRFAGPAFAYQAEGLSSVQGEGDTINRFDVSGNPPKQSIAVNWKMDFEIIDFN